MTGAEIDARVRVHTRELGGIPSQLGYQGFPAAVCVSPNDVVCHGIPTASMVLSEGDIVNTDVTTNLAGWHGDTSRTWLIGEVSPEARHVVHVAERCMLAGIEAIRVGGFLGDVGQVIEDLARREGCSIVRGYGGHGIGRRMHLPPHVSHHGPATTGARIVEGMTFTIEPMVNLGSEGTWVGADGWTVRTRDGSLSAQFEHTVHVHAHGAEILTVPP